MWNSIECAGHPRDMGLSQGAAAAEAIRAACREAGLSTRHLRWPSLRAWADGPRRGHGAALALLRHFSHQAERLDGMARAAGVPFDSVLALHARLAVGGPALADSPIGRRAVLQARTTRDDEGARCARLERTLPSDANGSAGWLLRESRPVVGFRSIEIGLPWLVTGVAGVNEAGLAVTAGPVASEQQPEREAVPALLLAQECLQRFADLGGALDWCRKRPVFGDQTFVLADASGQVATVRIAGAAREVQAGCGELFLEAGEPGADRDAAGRDAGPRVCLDPARRSLILEAPGARLELSVEASEPGDGRDVAGGEGRT